MVNKLENIILHNMYLFIPEILNCNILECIYILFILCFTYLLIETNIYRLKIIGTFSAILLYFLSVLMWIQFLPVTNTFFQYELYIPISYQLGLTYHLAVDGISLYFIILTFFLLVICLLASWTSITYKVKEFYILMFLLTFLLFHVFCLLDLLFFYIAFESVLIPMYLIIGIWGSRDRKIHASYQFFLYTLAGSLVMLLAIIYIYLIVGSFHYYEIKSYCYGDQESKLLWLAFFLAFAVKIPVIPVHIWLPEAHVEAPTAGSVMLAGILLKMGGYGLIRFSLVMFPTATIFFQPFVYTICIFSIIYGVFTTIRQTDLKKIIAYSSIVHMSYVLIGIISRTAQGLEGGIFMMISHGLISSALFLCVGFLYERHHTRVLLYYGGFVLGMPIFSIIFFILTLANISLPGTTSFIGEFGILLGIFDESKFLLFVGCIGIILSAVYAIWFYNRLVFGNYKKKYFNALIDFNLRETFVIGICLSLCIFFGIYPNLILDNLHLPVNQIVFTKLVF